MNDNNNWFNTFMLSAKHSAWIYWINILSFKIICCTFCQQLRCWQNIISVFILSAAAADRMNTIDSIHSCWVQSTQHECIESTVIHSQQRSCWEWITVVYILSQQSCERVYTDITISFLSASHSRMKIVIINVYILSFKNKMLLFTVEHFVLSSE